MNPQGRIRKVTRDSAWSSQHPAGSCTLCVGILRNQPWQDIPERECLCCNNRTSSKEGRSPLRGQRLIQRRPIEPHDCPGHCRPKGRIRQNRPVATHNIFRVACCLLCSPYGRLQRQLRVVLRASWCSGRLWVEWSPEFDRKGPKNILPSAFDSAGFPLAETGRCISHILQR